MEGNNSPAIQMEETFKFQLTETWEENGGDEQELCYAGTIVELRGHRLFLFGS